jgi:hypothetical protein
LLLSTGIGASSVGVQAALDRAITMVKASLLIMFKFLI